MFLSQPNLVNEQGYVNILCWSWICKWIHKCSFYSKLHPDYSLLTL